MLHCSSMENFWQDLPLRAACLFSQSGNLTCVRQAALRSSFFYKGREEKELTARRCLARAGPERGFLLPGVFLQFAQLLLFSLSLWPGSASLPRLRSCLARPRQTKKVSIKCDRNFRIIENRLFSQRSAPGCASIIKPETPSICLAQCVGTQFLAFQGLQILRA